MYSSDVTINKEEHNMHFFLYLCCAFWLGYLHLIALNAAFVWKNMSFAVPKGSICWIFKYKINFALFYFDKQLVHLPEVHILGG